MLLLFLSVFHHFTNHSFLRWLHLSSTVLLLAQDPFPDPYQCKFIKDLITVDLFSLPVQHLFPIIHHPLKRDLPWRSFLSSGCYLPPAEQLLMSPCKKKKKKTVEPTWRMFLFINILHIKSEFKSHVSNWSFYYQCVPGGEWEAVMRAFGADAHWFHSFGLIVCFCFCFVCLCDGFTDHYLPDFAPGKTSSEFIEMFSSFSSPVRTSFFSSFSRVREPWVSSWNLPTAGSSRPRGPRNTW